MKKKIIIISICAVCAVLFVIILNRGNRKNSIPNNPLLQGSICYQGVISLNSAQEGYIYRYINVHCNEGDLSAFTEKDYIEFLEKGIEGFADDVGEYQVYFDDTATGILYLNGNSSIGYYVDRSINNSNLTYSPGDGRCDVIGTVKWDGTKVTYTPNDIAQYLLDIRPLLNSKYKIPDTPENQQLTVRMFPMW